MITEQTNGLEHKQTNEQTFFNHSTKTAQQPEHSKAKLAERDIDKAARVAAKAGLKDYVDKLEAIARLLRKAAEKVVEKNITVEYKDGVYYLGHEGVYAYVEHNEGRATITAKYGDKVAVVELDIKEMERYAVLANLAAIAVRDSRNILNDHARHTTKSPIQAADRLLMWSVFMPCEYALTVVHVNKIRSGLSPYIEVKSFFGEHKMLARKVLERSPIHRLLLKASDAADGDYVLAISWLMIYSILAAPEGGKPSDGAKSGAIPGAILEWLKPYLEELDALLGPISTNDKAFLIAKMADYNGRIVGRKAIVKVGSIDDVIIVVDGDRIRLVDLIEAAAKAFSEKGKTQLSKKKRGKRYAVFYGIPPVAGPAIKAVAAAGEAKRRLEGLLEYGESIRIGDVEMVPVKAREEVVEFAEGVMAKFKERYYTHLRLVDGDEAYDLLHRMPARKCYFIGIVNRRIAEALRGIGVWINTSGQVMISEDQLAAVLAALAQIGVKVYAVRKVKRSERNEMGWIVRIGAVELRMFYRHRDRCLSKGSKNGKIPVIINGRPGVLDLKKLATGEGEIEKAVAEALNKSGIKWRVLVDRRYGSYLHIYLPRIIYLPRQTTRP